MKRAGGPTTTSPDSLADTLTSLGKPHRLQPLVQRVPGLSVEIQYRRSTGSWRAYGFKDEYDVNGTFIAGYGSLRRARRRAKEWIAANQDPTLFEVVQ